MLILSAPAAAADRVTADRVREIEEVEVMTPEADSFELSAWPCGAGRSLRATPVAGRGRAGTRTIPTPVVASALPAWGTPPQTPTAVARFVMVPRAEPGSTSALSLRGRVSPVPIGPMLSKTRVPSGARVALGTLVRARQSRLGVAEGMSVTLTWSRTQSLGLETSMFQAKGSPGRTEAGSDVLVSLMPGQETPPAGTARPASMCPT